jgi:hypothetical protein
MSYLYLVKSRRNATSVARVVIVVSVTVVVDIAEVAAVVVIR